MLASASPTNPPLAMTCVTVNACKSSVGGMGGGGAPGGKSTSCRIVSESKAHKFAQKVPHDAL